MNAAETAKVRVIRRACVALVTRLPESSTRHEGQDGLLTLDWILAVAEGNPRREATTGCRRCDHEADGRDQPSSGGTIRHGVFGALRRP